MSAELDDDGWDEWASRQTAELAAEADVLRVSARIEVWAAPFVIVGSCDGRGFYLRERHGSYRVTIAGNDDPSSDPWKAEPTETSIDVAAGDEAELRDNHGVESAAVSLRVAVAAVRTTVARDTCPHAIVTNGPYCPTCGVLLADAGHWQLPDPV